MSFEAFFKIVATHVRNKTLRKLSQGFDYPFSPSELSCVLPSDFPCAQTVLLPPLLEIVVVLEIRPIGGEAEL